jgi:hypothetical protein
MVSIENKLDQFSTYTEESVDILIEGSDDHLDRINSIKIPLDKLGNQFEELNNHLFENIDVIPNENAIELLPRMKRLNKSSMTLIGAIKTCYLYRDVRNSLKSYSKQLEIFQEIFHDVYRVKLAQDKEMDNILNDLNEL